VQGGFLKTLSLTGNEDLGSMGWKGSLSRIGGYASRHTTWSTV